jgi:glycosyltransferase involved in cell wall biosynthesis
MIDFRPERIGTSSARGEFLNEDSSQNYLGTRTLKICFVVFSNGWGGAETVVRELARHLYIRGHSILILTNDEMLPFYSGSDGIGVQTVGRLYPMNSLVRMIQSKKKKTLLSNAALFVITYFHELYGLLLLRLSASRLLRVEHPDLLHSHMALADIFVGRLRDSGIPAVTTIHGEHILRGQMPVHCMFKPLIFLKASLFQESILSMDRVVMVSYAELRASEEWIPIPPEKVRVIHNGVDLARIRDHIVSESKASESEFRLVFPGGAKWSKGGDMLVSAIRRLRELIPNVHLYVAGNVSPDSQLRELVKKKGVEGFVTFTGFLHGDSYISLLKSSDVFVLPSRREGFPLSILEAMACGKPIVATDSGGIREVMKDGINGIISSPDPDSLVSAVYELYSNEPLRRQIAKNNMRDVREFDWKSITGEYIRIYEEVLDFGSS